MSADRPPHDGRRDTREDEVLELAGAPRELFARIHRALQRHLRPHTTDGEGPCLTGGGILEARWDHRESRDIEIVIRARTRGDVREALDAAASEAGGYRVQGPEIDHIEFPDHTKDEHVDVSFVKPNPHGGAKQATVDGQKATVLSTAQIMTGKLEHRGLHSPARAVFDVAVCGLLDPPALEAAVNALRPEKQKSLIRIYALLADTLAEQAASLGGVRPEFEAIRRQPARAATEAVTAAQYRRVRITTSERGDTSIETTTRQRIARHRCTSREELLEVLDERGLNAFLEAHDRDPVLIAEVACTAMETGNPETIIDLELASVTGDATAPEPDSKQPEAQRRPDGNPSRAGAPQRSTFTAPTTRTPTARGNDPADRNDTMGPAR